MQIDQAPATGGSVTAGNEKEELLTFAEQQRRMVENMPASFFVPQAMTELRAYYQAIDLAIHELEIKHYGGDANFNSSSSDQIERLKAMAPTADMIMARLLGENVSPEGRVVLRSAQKTIAEAIEQYPKVPYFGADPSHEFQIGRNLLGVALRMMELGFHRPAA